LSISQPVIPDFATNNGHMYYLVCKTPEQRTNLITHLRELGIHSVFHYQSLHASDYFKLKHDGRDLSNADSYSDRLVRLPFYYELTTEDQDLIITAINKFGGRRQSLFRKDWTEPIANSHAAVG